MNKAVFIDKDGTLIRDIPYNVDPEKIELEQGAGEALKKLRGLGFLIIIISNQAGVAYGYFGEAQIAVVRSKIEQLLAAFGVQLSDFYYCPHHPAGNVSSYTMEC